MSGEKVLRPPFVWRSQKAGLVEDERYQRWSQQQVRAMRDGTYDWSTHQEARADGSRSAS